MFMKLATLQTTTPINPSRQRLGAAGLPGGTEVKGAPLVISLEHQSEFFFLTRGSFD